MELLRSIISLFLSISPFPIDKLLSIVSSLFSILKSIFPSSRKDAYPQSEPQTKEEEEVALKRLEEAHQRLRAKEEKLKRLEEAYHRLGTISQQCSLANAETMCQLEVTASDFTYKTFFPLCEEVSQVQKLAAVYEPSLREDADELYGQLSVFWNCFRNVIRLSYGDEKADAYAKNSAYQLTIDASYEVGRIVRALQLRIRELSDQYRTDG